MTSFTRKLYAQDPAAAVAYHRQSKFEVARASEAQAVPGLVQIAYGRHPTLLGFTLQGHQPTSNRLCAASCGRRICRDGCKLFED